MFGFGDKKKLQDKIKELQSALDTASWRASALLADLKKTESRLSDKSSRLSRLEFEHRSLVARYNQMVREHNAMVDEFAYNSTSGGNPFSPEDLKVLIGLCHPDKHGGKDSAKRITQILLEMRGKK